MESLRLKISSDIRSMQRLWISSINKVYTHKKINPKYDWISYNEPEEHLDRLAKTITKLPGINKYSKVCGLSYKEDTLLERLKKKVLKTLGEWIQKKILKL